MTLLAAFQVLLYRYSGQQDFAVGSPIANRTRPEIEPLVGCFINMIVLRANLAGNPTFRDLLGQVRQTAPWRPLNTRNCRLSGWWRP